MNEEIFKYKNLFAKWEHLGAYLVFMINVDTRILWLRCVLQWQYKLSHLFWLKAALDSSHQRNSRACDCLCRVSLHLDAKFIALD
jgi:hypothetical protein